LLTLKKKKAVKKSSVAGVVFLHTVPLIVNTGRNVFLNVALGFESVWILDDGLIFLD